MGRRKIEIQPITHERNRSVTFLKRKNGLFKKAYELGVLCSVDVAVIIFEERTGHHLKLYQYCSSDIHDIIQRHIRFDGEKDTRTPHDFVNNANAKLDDAGDGDDDDADDDDPDSNTRGGSKKRSDVKLKQDYNTKPMPPPGGNGGLNVDVNEYPLHRPMTIPQPPLSLHHSPPLPPASGTPTLPISTERHATSGRLLPADNQLSSQKKPRLAPSISPTNHPKVSSEDSVYSGYVSSPTSAHHSTSYRQNNLSSHPLHYGYSGATASGSPQQSFLSSSFEFPSSSRGPPISRSAGYNPRSSSSYSQHQDSQLQGMYQLMRHNLPPGQPPSSSGSRPQQSPDLLSAFLDNGDEHRPPPTHSSQFGPLDWPSHAPSHESHTQQHDPGHSGDTSWLDFLSNSAQPPGGQPLHMALPPASGRDGLSWERDRNMEHYAPSERGGADKGMVNGAGVSPTSRKRPRADSLVEDGRRLSPGSRTKLGIGPDGLNASDPHGSGIKEE